MIRSYAFVCLVFVAYCGVATAQPDANGVYVIFGPEHAAEKLAAAAKEIAPVKYAPKMAPWKQLPRVATALAKKCGELRIVMLGDSIVNDTARSRWGDRLQEHYPECKISVVAIVRGGTGCWWYKEDGRVAKYVVPQKPDLLIIGGISHNDDIGAVREVMKQVRNEVECDVLLMSEAFGAVDPTDDKQWTFDIPDKSKGFRAKLRDLAVESKVGFLDMTAYWGLYIRESGHELKWFKRDPVHANIRGEQVVGGILFKHLSSQPPASK